MHTAMIGRYMFLLLWASQGNTGPSAFWLLLYLMKHPAAMAAREGGGRRHRQRLRAGGPPRWPFDPAEPGHAGQDVHLGQRLGGDAPAHHGAAPHPSRGSGYEPSRWPTAEITSFGEGDRLAIFPYSAVQQDPEIHPDPRSFKYDRFLHPDGSKENRFLPKAGRG
ncbi:unnamed protein product [Lampetra planeri]